MKEKPYVFFLGATGDPVALDHTEPGFEEWLQDRSSTFPQFIFFYLKDPS